MAQHYFDLDEAPATDIWLSMAKQQGYVPSNCLLSGEIVMALTNKGDDPCKGCEGPRHKCGGRPKSD